MATVDRFSFDKACDECRPCSGRRKTGVVNYFCQDCPEYLCDDCKEYHDGHAVTRGHTIVSGNSIPVCVSSFASPENIPPSLVITCDCNKH